jgi:hypothetical protein
VTTCAPACLSPSSTAASLPAARELGMATVHFTGTRKDVAEIERLMGIA